MESLFSLEVIVNYVKIKHQASSPASSQVQCLFPTVAFRLLDYPTIAINLLDPFDAREIKTQLNIQQPFEKIETLPCFRDLFDKYGRYIFSKGKSCLFRCNIDSLKAYLRHTPMYLMVLDTFFEPYKLVGTTMVPLTNLINDIYAETYEVDSLDSPCTKMTHGVFEIKNLMGEEIGFISFAARLTSFGTSLLPHIERTTAESLQRQAKLKAVQKNKKKKSKPIPTKNKKKHIEIDEVSEADEENYEDTSQLIKDHYYKLHKKPLNQSTAMNTLETMNNSNAMIQTMKIDYKDAQVQFGHAEPKKKDQYTQSPKKQPKPEPESEPEPVPKPIAPEAVPPELYQVTHVPEEPLTDQFCPPVMYYNMKSPENVSKIADNRPSQSNQVLELVEKKKFINDRIDFLNNAIQDGCFSDESKEDSDSSNSETNKYQFPVKQQDKHNNVSNFDLSKMPLLQCLFDEMNILKNQIENQQPNLQAAQPVQLEPFITNLKQTQLNASNKPTNLSTTTLTRPKKPSKTSPNPNANKQQIQKPVSILRTSKKINKKLLASKKSTNSTFSSKESMVDSVNRLSQPRQQKGKKQMNSQKEHSTRQEHYYNEYDETPVGPISNNSEANLIHIKQPLKYGSTRAHRMRVEANRQIPQPMPRNLDNSNTKRENLINTIKSNIDELNQSRMSNSVHNETDDLLSRNLDKVMFETIDSTMKDSVQQSRSYSFKNTAHTSLINKSNNKSMNFSLLNKVEMDSTNDCTMNTNAQIHYEQAYNHYQAQKNFVDENSSDDDDVFEEPQNAKVVQFGRTYVLNTSANPTSEESTVVANSSQEIIQRQQSLTNVTKSFETYNEEFTKSDVESNGDRNIFLENRNRMSDDFHSSLDSTLTPHSPQKRSSNDFFPEKSNEITSSQNQYSDNEDNSYGEIEYLGFTGDQSDILKSTSKHSNSNYNSKSFVTDSLSNTKDSLRSQSS